MKTHKTLVSKEDWERFKLTGKLKFEDNDCKIELVYIKELVI